MLDLASANSLLFESDTIVVTTQILRDLDCYSALSLGWYDVPSEKGRRRK